MNSKGEVKLLQDVGVSSTINKKTVGKVSKFIRTMCYAGTKVNQLRGQSENL